MMSLPSHNPELFFIATLGPTWEFKLCLKSCNLASWATKWHDYIPVDHHIDSATDPPHRLRNRPTHPTGYFEFGNSISLRKVKFVDCVRGV